MRRVPFVPETLELDTLMAELRRQRAHLASSSMSSAGRPGL